MGIIEWLDSALQDARYGLRQLRKTPAVVLAVVLSLTIGVGANTAIFSLVDAALLKPLPVHDPDSLRIVEWTTDSFPEGVSNINGDFNQIAGGRVQASSVGANLYRSLAREQTVFEALIGIADPNSAAIAVDTSPAEQVSIQYVSSNFFQGLGASPAIGRPFRDEEDHAGHEPVVIVSHRFWTRHLEASNTIWTPPSASTTWRPTSSEWPQGFFGLRAGQWTDVYAPIAMRVAFQGSQRGGAPRGENEGDWWIRQIGRLKPGVPEPVARTRIADLFRNLAAPEGSKIESKAIPELITLPGRRGFNALNARDASALWILMLLVGVLLLIVCANVANLLLSRSVGRQRESAVRLALGAARTRLFRQHLIESGVVALVGGGTGVALGYVLAQSIHLALSFLALLAVALLAAWIPARRAAAVDPMAALREE
jgi:hypothetical protein